MGVLAVFGTFAPAPSTETEQCVRLAVQSRTWGVGGVKEDVVIGSKFNLHDVCVSRAAWLSKLYRFCCNLRCNRKGKEEGRGKGGKRRREEGRKVERWRGGEVERENEMCVCAVGHCTQCVCVCELLMHRNSVVDTHQFRFQPGVGQCVPIAFQDVDGHFTRAEVVACKGNDLVPFWCAAIRYFFAVDGVTI